MDKINSNRSYTGLVQKYVGSAYDHVRRVSEHLDEILKLADLDGIEDLVKNITEAEQYAILAVQAAEEAKQFRDQTALIVASFNDFYLGPFVTPPHTDNTGGILKLGALYLDISKPDISMMAWVGTEWIVSYSTLSKVPHSALEALSEDDHLQYLTSSRHALIGGNPHNTAFLNLPDTPDSYADQAGNIVVVNPCEDGLAFFNIGEVSGYLPLTGGIISGDLSVLGKLSTPTVPENPSDVVNLKFLEEFVPETEAYLPLTGGILSGDIIIEDGNFISRAKGSAQFDIAGLLVRDKEGVDKSVIGYTGDIDATIITHAGQGAITTPDSYLILKNGLLHIDTYGAYDIHNPIEDNNLITKGYLHGILDGGDGSQYLPLTGGTLSGSLEVKEFLNVLIGSNNSSGLYVYGASGDPEIPNVKGAFYYDIAADLMVLGQRDLAGVGIPDTALHLKGGAIDLQVTVGTVLLPEAPTHLATIGFVRSLVDGGTGIPYLPLTGGALSGQLHVSEFVGTIKKAGDDLVGFGWKDENSIGKGGIGYDFIKEATKITELGPDGVTENSNVLIKNGIIDVTTALVTPAVPSLPTHLVNLSYLDTTLPGIYLPLVGGELSGSLILNHELRVLASADPFNGMSMYAADGTSIKAAVTYHSVADSIQLWQQGAGPVGNPDTMLEVVDGKASVQSATGKDLAPTLPHHLANMQFVLDQIAGVTPPGGGYLPISGGNLTGPLTAKHSVTVYPDGVDNGTGFAIYSDAAESTVLGGLHYDSNTTAIHITQNNNDNAGAPDTYVTLKAGLLSVSSPSGYNVHNPIADNNLVTRKYVTDSIYAIGGPFLSLSGGTVTGTTTFKNAVVAGATPSVSTHLIPRGYADTRYLKASNNTVTGDLTDIGDIYSRQVNSSDPDWGFGLKSYNGQFVGSFSYDNTNKQVRISQLVDARAKTQLIIEKGKIAMYGFDGESIAPISSNHLVPLGYAQTMVADVKAEILAEVANVGITTTVDLPGGKTLHIVDGLITEVS